MALRLIVGPAGSGKSARLREALESSVRASVPALVVPTAPDAREWSGDLARDGLSGIGVATFEAWVRSLWALHGDGRGLVGAAARTSLIRKAIGAEDPGLLGESGKSKGFPLLMADVVRRVPFVPEREHKDEVRAVATILRTYHRLLSEFGLIEQAEAMHIMSLAPPVLATPVFVSRFTDLEAGQEELLVSLAKAADVTITLPWRRGAAASAGLDALVERLAAGGAEIEEVGPDADSEPHLARFCAAIFEAGTALPVTDAVGFAEAGGAEAECALVAQVVREALDTEDAPLRIAVTFRDVGRRLDILAAALDAQNIAFEADVRVPFARSPLGAALLAGLDAWAGRGGGRARLGAFLASPYSGAEASWVAEEERAWRRRAMSSRDAFNHAVRNAPKDAAYVLRLVQSVGTHGAHRESLWLWQKLVGLMLSNAHARRQGGGVSAVDASAHRALLSAIQELADLGDGATEGELGTALRSVEVSTGAGDSAGVLVTEAHRLKGRRFDVVVIGGLTADEFSPEPRESLAGALVSHLGSRVASDEKLQERAVFHAVITRAQRRLVLVRQASDERGGPVRPSAFWEEALDVYRSAEAAAAGLTPEALSIRKASLAELERTAPAFLRSRSDARNHAGDTAPTAPSRGALHDERVLRTLAERREFSISEAETYLACPYRWFLERAVRPREIDAVFDVRERGSLAHRILSDFYGRWRADGHERVTKATVSAALVLARSVAEEQTANHAILASSGLAARLDAATSIRWALAAVEDDAGLLPGYVPTSHEFAFGQAAGRPVTFGDVELRGFIDRIDEGPDGAVVTDYKAARIVSGRAGFETSGALQAPLYAAVVRELTGRSVVGALYRSLSSRTVRGSWVAGAIDLDGRGSGRDAVSADVFAEDIGRALERLTEAVQGIRSGLIAPRPRSGACRSCLAAVRCEEARS